MPLALYARNIKKKIILPSDPPSSAFSKETISETHSPDAVTMNSNNAGDGSSTIVMPSTGSSSETTIIPHLTHSMSLQRQSSWKIQTPRLRFVSSVEFRHSSGETSTTPLSPESPNSPNSSGDNNNRPSRLQRSKASSRKTFRSRRGRQYTAEVSFEIKFYVSFRYSEREILFLLHRIFPIHRINQKQQDRK